MYSVSPKGHTDACFLRQLLSRMEIVVFCRRSQLEGVLQSTWTNATQRFHSERGMIVQIVQIKEIVCWSALGLSRSDHDGRILTLISYAHKRLHNIHGTDIFIWRETEENNTNTNYTRKPRCIGAIGETNQNATPLNEMAAAAHQRRRRWKW